MDGWMDRLIDRQTIFLMPQNGMNFYMICLKLAAGILASIVPVLSAVCGCPPLSQTEGSKLSPRNRQCSMCQ